MTNRDMDRERNGQAQASDDNWDWYYYEYRYVPYMPGPYSTNQDRNDWRSGRYVGKGPRGYQRTDDRIREDINERLTWHGGIDASDIQVDVNNGIVTLDGSVNSRYEKRMAEDIVDSVPGVQDVNNNLTLYGQSRRDRRQSEMGMGNNQIREGMEVIGTDGQRVGKVKEVRSSDFLVDRSMARDVYVPFDACQSADGQIRLNIRADEVDNQNWPEPDLLGAGGTSTSRKNR